ncbi:hypothetical protein C8Q80DRAFT_1269301 [Daedaleopsis nitida]|nr:hypothetical protein C8Q80DRAFT_1269301 [Daedaleopsis nitida]
MSATMTAFSDPPSNSTITGPSDSAGKPNLGAIIGGVIGGVLFLAVLLLCRRQRWRVSVVIKRKAERHEPVVAQIAPLPFLSRPPSPVSATRPSSCVADVERPLSTGPCASEPPSYHSEGAVVSHPPALGLVDLESGHAPAAVSLLKGASRARAVGEDATDEAPPAYTS